MYQLITLLIIILCSFLFQIWQYLLAAVVEGDQKAPFLIATTLSCWLKHYSFPWIAPLDMYLILLSVKQRGIKYHF